MQKVMTNLITLAFVLVVFAGITPTASAQVIGDELDSLCSLATTGTAELANCDEGEKQLCSDVLPPGAPDGEEECTEDVVDVFAPEGEPAISNLVTGPVDELDAAMAACFTAYEEGEFGPGGDGVSELGLAACNTFAALAPAQPVLDLLDCIVTATFAYLDASDPDPDFTFSGETLTNVIVDDGSGNPTLDPEWLANEGEFVNTILFGCALASGPVLDSVALTTGSENSDSDYFAAATTTLDVDISASGPVSVTSVDFVFDPEGAATVFYTDNAPSDVNSDGLTWTATSPAATAGDGVLRAIVHWDDGAGGDPQTTDSDNDAALDNTPPAFASVKYYEDDAGSPGAEIMGSFINSLDHTTVHVGVTVDEANVDNEDTVDDKSTVTVTHPGGTETQDVPTDGSEFFFAVTPGSAGAIDVTSALRDWAENEATPSESINYGPPEVAITLISDNGKDITAWAIEGDAITLTFEDLPGSVAGTPQAQILDADGDSLTGVLADMTGAGSPWTLAYTVTDSDLEGAVSIYVEYNDGADQVSTSTTDLSGITIDRTPPTSDVSFPRDLGDDFVGYDDSVGVEVDVAVGPSFDATIGAIVFTVTTGDDDEELDPQTFADDGTASTDGESYRFIVDAADVSEGATLSWDIGSIEDLAGNDVDPDGAGPVALTALTQWITTDITHGGESVDDLSTFIGKGDFGSLTFDVTFGFEDLDTEDDTALSAVGLEFFHAVGNAFKVTAVTPSNGDDFPLVFKAQDGTVDSVEIELDQPLSSDGSSYSFEFTLVNNEDGGDFATLDTNDVIAFTAYSLDNTFAELAGEYASSSVRADVTGPTIAGHAYAADTGTDADAEAGPDGRLNYLEFTTADNMLIASLTGIVDNENGIGAASVQVGLLEDDVFTALSGLGALDGGEDIDLELVTSELGAGATTFVARAVDELGNVGDDLTEELEIAIKQFLVVTPGDEPVWVGPDEQVVAGLFSIEPVDVVQELKRYDLKVEDGEYSLAAFGAPGFFAGTTGDGEVRLLRHTSPANDAILTVDANLFGLTSKPHLTQSDFELFALNSEGKSTPLTVVDSDFEDFSGAVFSAKLDAVAPELAFGGVSEEPDEAGQYQAEAGAKLTFNFEVSDADSGLADTPVRLDEYDADEDSWAPYQGIVAVDEEEGTLEIARETAGRFTYRLAAIDAVGNEAYSANVVADVKGTATAAIDDISISTAEGDIVPVGADPAIHYIDMDSTSPDEQASSDDVATISATVLIDAAPEAGVDVEFLLGSDVLGSGTTDEAGLASMDLDPDAEALDLDDVVITVRVPAQTISGAEADLAIEEVTEDVNLVWTGFYVDVGASSNLVAPGASYLVTTSVYWRHEVQGEDGIEIGDAIPIGSFDGDVELVEDLGGQTGDFEVPIEFDATSDNPGVFAGISHGEALEPGTAGDADAGYRRYTAALSGDLPGGLMGTSIVSGEDMVLVSAIGLTFESGTLLGFAGETGTYTVDAGWLHSQDYDGFTEVQILAPITMNGVGGSEISTFENALDGGPVTGTFTFPDGLGDIDVSGTSEDGPVLPLGFDIQGVAFAYISGPDGGPVSPGAEHDDSFSFAIAGSPVDDTFAGIDASLDVEIAGAASVAQVYDAVAIADQTPFGISLAGQPVTPLNGFEHDGATAFEFTLDSPDFGVYDLLIDLVIAESGDIEVTLPAPAQEYQEFGISHTLLQISVAEIWHEGEAEGEPENNLLDDPTSDEEIADEDLGDFWIDWDNELIVAQVLDVASVNWDGETASNPAALDGATIELSYQIDGGEWSVPTEHVADVSGQVTVEVVRPLTDDEDPLEIWGTVLYTGRVIHDGDEAVASPDDANVPFAPAYFYTGIDATFATSGDLLEIAGETLGADVDVFYLHDGAPAVGVELTFAATDGVDGSPVATSDELGEASVLLTRESPDAVDDLAVSITGATHGLTAVVGDSYAGVLRWIDVLNAIAVEQSSDGSNWEDVAEEGGFYTTQPGNFIRVTVDVVLDDGTEDPQAVESGIALFNGDDKELVGGSASKTFWSNTDGQTSALNIDIEDIEHAGTAYGDFADVFDGTLRWQAS